MLEITPQMVVVLEAPSGLFENRLNHLIPTTRLGARTPEGSGEGDSHRDPPAGETTTTASDDENDPPPTKLTLGADPIFILLKRGQYLEI